MDAVELTRVGCFILIGALLVVAVLRQGRWRDWLRDTRAVFARHGVKLEDSETFRWVARPLEDSDAELRGFVEDGNPPGADPEQVGTGSISLLRVPLPGDGLLVVPSDLVEPLLGPLPPVPRVRTGEARFDAAFALFAHGGDLPRCSACCPSSPTSW
ncbi:hypothetical protein [Pyxidicoccus xibeiensis]|uniref:hypothetical protein n=1 Tax=Pyxidicoccus xibeiensis TaxID=2906759 RepID=UPI0020A7AE4E|nr:hypothetical protein [Pyxidicoccus xibeiensis]MCP3138293.1 hypothetical protein [Pyxidicoccus xibeiensis]